MWTVPSPWATTSPRAYGLPVHLIAARVANGPKSSTPIFAAELPRPLTVIASEIRAPGTTTSAETSVPTTGAARRERRLGVVARTCPVKAAVCGAAAIDSR